MTAAVNTPSSAVQALAEPFAMLEALMGGTPSMRAAGHKLLPKWPNEEDAAYQARLRTATLFPAFRRTVSVMGGKPFSKPLTLSDDTPADIEAWCDDIDREGVNLHTFAAEMLNEALAYGICGILVDAPLPIPPGAAPVPTVADQKAAGVRPYFVRVKHDQIIGFQITVTNSVRTLTQLRIAENEMVADGAFGEKLVQRVRVLTPGAWQVWRKLDDVSGVAEADQWVLDSEGETTLTAIPFVPIYGSRTGFMTGISPLLDLAFINVKHWQRQSDHDNLIHIASVPILCVTGGEENTKIIVGASSAVMLPMGATMEFVEHTGQAIGAGAASLEDMEQQMIQAGAELLVKTPGTRTATESSNDAEANKCDLQRITEGFEDALDTALDFLAQYASLPTGGEVTLFKDFGATSLSDASGQLILSLEAAGVITKQTVITEMQRRGTLSADLDPDEEVQNAEDQAPDLPPVPPMPPAHVGGPGGAPTPPEPPKPPAA